MMDYIVEQAKICKKIIKKMDTNLQSFKQLVDNKQPKNWLILATGSSLNATLSAKYYIEKIAGITIDVLEPFTFVHYEKVKPTTDFILGISQSGHSSSTIEALKKANSLDEIPTATLTANINSPITNYANLVIDIGCGDETVGYVTKGFSSTVLTLMLMGLITGESLGQLTTEERIKELAEFNAAIEKIPYVIEQSERFYHQYAEELKQIPRFAVVGYGPTVGTAKESETKFTETIRIPTQGFELEAFMHGPYLEISESYGLFFIQTKSEHAKRARKLREYFSKYTNHCFTIATGKVEDDKTMSIGIEIEEYKSPLVLAIPFQVFAYHIATDSGIDLQKAIFEDFDEVLKSKI